MACHSHDWMPMGSREICVRCGKGRMREDLPAWEVDNKGTVITKAGVKYTKPKENRRGK